MLLSSAPQASSGRAARTPSASRAGTRPRERRRTSGPRSTESSVRVSIGRSWTRKCVGDRGQALACVVVGEGDRLVGDVAAGHHERQPGVAQQQVVERRVGEHHAQLAHARCDRRRDRRVRPPGGDHDRPVGRRQPRALGLGEGDELPRVLGHQRERAVLAVLARAQPRDGRLVVGPAREVVAADPLDRQDRAAAEQRRGGRHRVAGGGAAVARRDQPRPRPAVRARVRLGVEAAVRGVLVLRPARGAHGEPRHRRERAVIRHVAHDREPRPAVRAVDERVAEAPVRRVEQLAEAGRARRRVRRDRRRGAAAALALHDRERPLAARGHAPAAHPLDRGERWGLGGQPRQEPLDRGVGPLDLQQHAVLVVAHPAAEPLGVREPPHERPEADALHGALDAGARPHAATSSRST